jgi:hypothetical protein
MRRPPVRASSRLRRKRAGEVLRRERAVAEEHAERARDIDSDS